MFKKLKARINRFTKEHAWKDWSEEYLLTAILAVCVLDLLF